MKTKLTLSIDEELVPAAKRHARSRGVSLSALVEDALRSAVASSGDAEGSLVERWRGRLRLADRDDDPRYRHLVDKYS